MKHTFETAFELGQRVYYMLPDSPEGLITGIGYNLSTNLVTYYVTFNSVLTETAACLSWELSSDKVIV